MHSLHRVEPASSGASQRIQHVANPISSIALLTPDIKPYRVVTPLQLSWFANPQSGQTFRPTMSRDPRASRLEDDPFDKIDDNKPNFSNSMGGKSQHIRVVIQPGEANPFEPFLRGFFDVRGPQVTKHTGSFFHFSEREIKDLAMATIAFSVAIALVRLGGLGGLLEVSLGIYLPLLLKFTLFSMLALAPAFVLHELAHKFVARHYGCWAEFRADPRGLKIGLIIAFLIGFVFMAPGAVMVAGRIGRKENGIISLAGPLTNIILFFVGLIGGGLILSIYYHQTIADLIIFWMWGNAILGAFNMLPFGPLDGGKVKTWSEPIFWAFLAITILLVISVFNGFAFGILDTIAGIPTI